MKQIAIIVDDEMISLISLKEMLKRHFIDEIQFEFCESGAEALYLINELKDSGKEVALIISDYIMPAMKGDELLKRVHEKHPEIVNILLTGMASLDGVMNAVNNANLYQFISKPWSDDQLVLAIKRAFAFYNAHKEIRLKQIELTVANERLSKLDNSKNYFLYLLAHELYTPLTAIKLSNNMLRDYSDEISKEEYLNYIEESVIKLQKTSDLALLITRIRTSKYQFRFEAHTLSQKIQEILEVLTHELEINDEYIVTKIERTKTMLSFDANLFKLIMKSIIENSFKYSSTKSKVEVTYQELNGKCDLIISDDGIGFPVEIIENSFNLFNINDLQYHTSGIGLSLAAVKVILDAHGFDIELSNNDNGGARVKITMPKLN